MMVALTECQSNYLSSGLAVILSYRDPLADRMSISQDVDVRGY